MTGALFFLVDATSPWCVDIPAAPAFAEIILPAARHVVSYHVVLEGSGLASVPGAGPVPFEAGDVIVFPQGDPYVMASAPGVAPEFDPAATLDFFRALAGGRLPFTVTEGGGAPPPARFICGFLGCDTAPMNPLLAGLPRLLRVPRRPPGAPDLLDRLIEMTVAEARADRLGARSVRLGLSELMFVELLRRHLETRPAADGGWLAGLRDPVVGRALALLHADPAAGWSLARLARAAGASRSILAARFRDTVGETPMRYLARWRIQRAARLLADGDEKVATVAERAGFASEAAFSRAFKRETGVSPARWRDRR